ncbi:MAG: DUF1439 domain-containing protein [Oleiphilaceae bacterium]|nr:DUF1439 domain-containing protein [Oleiphilaceae bacterium]
MMRSITLPLLMTLALLASGCASMSPYSIDEATVEQHLQQQIRNFDAQQVRNGVPMRLELKRAKVRLGPDGREVVHVDFAGRASLDALMVRIPVDISFMVEGAPFYDGEKKAVFLRDLTLLESRLESTMGSLDLQPYAGAITTIASRFLDEYPVYELDETDLGQRLFGMMNMNIKVGDGRLTLVPGGDTRREGPVR